MNSKLGRIERALEIEFGKQEYARASNGMYEVPASEVLSCHGDGYELSIVGRMMHRAMKHFSDCFLEWAMGQVGMTTKEIEQVDRRTRDKTLTEFAQNYVTSPEESAKDEREYKAKTERILKKRAKAERDSGRPVKFLLPFDPIVFQCYFGNKDNPRYDARVYVKELIPVYKDGTAGDPKHYPINGPF